MMQIKNKINDNILRIYEKIYYGNFESEGRENVWYHMSNKDFNSFEHKDKSWDVKNNHFTSNVKKGSKNAGIFFSDTKNFAVDFGNQLIRLTSARQLVLYIIEFSRGINLLDMTDEKDVDKFLNEIQGNEKKFWNKFNKGNTLSPEGYDGYYERKNPDYNDKPKMFLKGLKTLKYDYTENIVFADIAKKMEYDGVVIEIGKDKCCYIFDGSLVKIIGKDKLDFYEYGYLYDYEISKYFLQHIKPNEDRVEADNYNMKLNNILIKNMKNIIKIDKKLEKKSKIDKILSKPINGINNILTAVSSLMK